MDAAIGLFKINPSQRRRVLVLITDGVPCLYEYFKVSKDDVSNCGTAVPICGCNTDGPGGTCIRDTPQTIITDRTCMCWDERCFNRNHDEFRCKYSGVNGVLKLNEIQTFIIGIGSTNGNGPNEFRTNAVDCMVDNSTNDIAIVTDYADLMNHISEIKRMVNPCAIDLEQGGLSGLRVFEGIDKNNTVNGWEESFLAILVYSFIITVILIWCGYNKIRGWSNSFFNQKYKGYGVVDVSSDTLTANSESDTSSKDIPIIKI